MGESRTPTDDAPLSAAGNGDQDAACPTEEQILRYVDGASPAGTDAALQDHLDGCTACRMLVGELTRGARAPVQTAERMNPTTFRAGDVVDGRYEVASFIARGGMGEVYRVHDRLLGQDVALKTLLCAAMDDAEATERLKREVLIARQVSHPNVCRILEFGVHDVVPGERTPFLTMELLEGETVGERVRRTGPLEVALVRSIVVQAVDGLDAIHAAGIIHRDLKGENLFIVSRPGGGLRVVVMDFGLARPVARAPGRAFSSDTRTAGTAEYMAPEQVLGQPLTAATDVYALGVTMFEMLTGQLPFAGDSPYAVAARRLVERAMPPSAHRADLPACWDAVVARCLEREPGARFSTVREVGEAIVRDCGGTMPLARKRSLRGPAAALASAVVLALVGGVWLVARRSAPEVGAAALPPPPTGESAQPSIPSIPEVLPPPVSDPVPDAGSPRRAAKPKRARASAAQRLRTTAEPDEAQPAAPAQPSGRDTDDVLLDPTN